VKYLVVLLLVVGNAYAQNQAGKYDLDFTALPVHQPKRVEWIVTERVDEVCQGLAPLSNGQKYIACTKFNDTACVVYTKPNLTLAELGHEMRHCFEGHWHQ
jgi:hypothetical protein